MKRLYKDRKFFKTRKSPIYTKFKRTKNRLYDGALSAVPQNISRYNNKIMINVGIVKSSGINDWVKSKASNGVSYTPPGKFKHLPLLKKR
jgi:hypothetical protein